MKRVQEKGSCGQRCAGESRHGWVRSAKEGSCLRRLTPSGFCIARGEVCDE